MFGPLGSKCSIALTVLLVADHTTYSWDLHVTSSAHRIKVSISFSCTIMTG